MKKNDNSLLKEKLITLAKKLINQEKARILMRPLRNARGFWFGSGNVIKEEDGTFYMVGRYRNEGDSRTGLEAGERGLELDIFAAKDFYGPFEKIKSFVKSDLDVGNKRVLSIEGSCLHKRGNEFELFISSEKAISYPEEVKKYQKKGTGIWTIDLISADKIKNLDSSSIKQVLASEEPPYLHTKDPVVFDLPNGDTGMIFCSHPFAWSSSNSGLAIRKKNEEDFIKVSESILHRGFVWDIAVTRITDRLPIPQIGIFKDIPAISLYFYDGAECVREHEQSSRGIKRARGYSCEEIGGLAWGFDEDFPKIERLSVNAPLFVSPNGTGCSRYVSTLVTEEAIYASWQQSQPDFSQPFVGHSLTMEEVEEIL